MLSGIYMIKNKKNKKIYIGQSKNIKLRWKHHISDLKNNKHHNRHLQLAWNKYGENEFEFCVIEYCNINELNEKEIYYIKYYDSYNNGYNLDLGGCGCKGYKHTDEEIHKMRLIQNPDPILQIDMSGNIIKEWISAGEAADTLGYSSCGGIKKCCDNDKYKTSNGFIWIYKNDLCNFNIDDHKNKFMTFKSVLQFDKNNKFIKEWKSIYEVCNIHNYKSYEIIKVCEGKRNTAYDFIWKYKDNPDLYDSEMLKKENILKTKYKSQFKSIIQYDKNKVFIKEWNHEEIIREGFNYKTIRSCCTGHTKTYKGFIWEYKNN